MTRTATSTARRLPLVTALAGMALALTGCQTPTPSATAGGTATAQGQVTAIDRDPWTFDGNATMQVATGSGAVTVEIPARLNLCHAEGLDAFAGLQVGDRIHAVGQVGADGHITVCHGAGHMLHKLD
ncbi:hypothetical protein [Lysobacter sp. A3-1-A15]|uniref:hypothetical protein n=1 Tax=Novilysobacter viscosus TaxID=3098602 RepID=UPI002EDA85C5